jgi:hypothetical protein
MALLNNLVGACNSILGYMEDLQGQNYAFNLGKKLGYLDYITSGLNISMTNPTMSQMKANGKIRRVELVYSQRTKDDVIRTGTDAMNATLCDDAETFQEQSTIVEIDNRIATRVLRFTNEQLNEICENPRAFMDKYIFQEMRAGREKLDKVLLAETDAAAGKILGHDGTTTSDPGAGAGKSLKLISVASNGERVPLFGPWGQIGLDYTNMELNGTPAVIGQGISYEFLQLAKWSCCNSAIPFDDAVALAGLAYFLDQNVNTVMGNNEFLVIAPGSQILLTYNENVNIGINTETARHIVIQDPVYPQLKWDLDFRWNECEKAWDTFLSFYFKLFNTFQDDSFNGSGSPDRLDGMTGIFKYVATAS